MIGLKIYQPKLVKLMNMVERYKQICQVQDILTKWFDTITSVFSTDDVILDCMVLRGYSSEEMYNHLKKIKMFKIDDIGSAELFCRLTDEEYELTGLKKNGTYLLSGRYCVPIRTIDNKVSAIVGYFPDQRKYVTTPTFGFSKNTSLFGVEHIEYLDAPYVCLCEGIFDTLSLQAYGFPALGNQGLDLSVYKAEMLKRYRRIVAIPDGDKAGASANPFKAHSVGRKNSWNIPFDNRVFIDLSVLHKQGIKDVDDYLKRGVSAEKLKDLDVIFSTSKYMYTLRS